jgi:putative tryptophan/tyrosine transport system substrate-binding protein
VDGFTVRKEVERVFVSLIPDTLYRRVVRSRGHVQGERTPQNPIRALLLRLVTAFHTAHKVGMKFFLTLCWSAAVVACLYPSGTSAREIVILNSNDIIPYNSCIDGIREALPGRALQLITIEQDLEKGREVLQKMKEPENVFVIAVGPQAAYVVSRAPQLFGRVFCMVLNPRKLLPPEADFSGVSLNIPPSLQIQTMKNVFPGRTRIGIFYSRQTNQALVNEYSEDAGRREMVIVGFPVDAASDVPAIMQSAQFDIDILLVVPDEVLNTTKVVAYLISEALRRKIPVVGYNRWFARNGAILSFIIDYQSVGRQTGTWVGKLLTRPAEDPATVKPPENINISIDLKTAQKLGIQIAPGMLDQADEVIR